MLLILTLRLILRSSRLFSKSSRITLHLRPLKVTGLITLRRVLFGFNSCLIQLIGQDFQPFLFTVKLLLLRERLCYDLFGFFIVKPEFRKVSLSTLYSAVNVIEGSFNTVQVSIFFSSFDN